MAMKYTLISFFIRGVRLVEEVLEDVLVRMDDKEFEEQQEWMRRRGNS
jgi:hypothetical protein